MSADKTGEDSSPEQLESMSEEQELAALREEEPEVADMTEAVEEESEDSEEGAESEVPWDTDDEPENPRFDVTEESEWTADGNDGEDFYSRSSVIDTDENIEFEVLERNAFDVGHQVFLWDTVNDADIDDWVNVTGYVVNVDTPNTDSIHQKFRLKLNMDAFRFKNSDEDDAQYIDVTVWNSTDIDCEVEPGDEIVLTSVVVDEFDGENYLSCNSASELHIVEQDYVEMVSEKIRTYLKHYGNLTTNVRH